MLHKHEIGVCVDEDVAYLLEEKHEENLITIIHADQTEGIGAASARTKKRRQAFLRKVFDIIRDFDKVSLCGPASVKTEIRKLFKDNSLREVQIKESGNDEITESQKMDFINRYFTPR